MIASVVAPSEKPLQDRYLLSNRTVLHVLFQTQELNVGQQPVFVEVIKGQIILELLQVTGFNSIPAVTTAEITEINYNSPIAIGELEFKNF